jgi:hypothetical protein
MANQGGGAENGPHSEFTCTDPQRVAGTTRCAEGWMHRPERATCPVTRPRDQEYDAPEAAACRKDSDCGDAPNFCTRFAAVASTKYACVSGCFDDEDCAEGEICACGDPAGVCSPAFCSTDAECPGSVCLGSQLAPCLGPTTPTFACAQLTDPCWGDQDCRAVSSTSACATIDGARQCISVGACGRPFFVQGVERRADAQQGLDWGTACAPDCSTLRPEVRSALAAHWTEMALMEHASIAAFSRFLLELLSLGAPSELLRDAQSALGDEIAHAEGCFALASAYLGKSIGPGRLSLDGVMSTQSRVELGVNAFREACLGETSAVADARIALDHARDAAVRRTLTRIVEDEARHAELGFRFVKWLLDDLPPVERAELAARIAHELSRVLHAAPPPFSAPPISPDHGLLSPQARAAAQRLALLEVAGPCTRALLQSFAGGTA